MTVAQVFRDNLLAERPACYWRWALPWPSTFMSPRDFNEFICCILEKGKELIIADH